MKIRILFFSETVSLAHRMRPSVLASGLDPQFYEVGFASDQAFGSLFEELKTAKLYSISSRTPTDFLEALKWARPFYDSDCLESYVRDDLRVIEDFKPDIIVGDFRISLGISARVAQVPFINLTNCYWSPHLFQKWYPPESVLTKALGVSLTEWALNRFSRLILKPHISGYLTVAKKWGQPVDDEPFSLNKLYHQGDKVFYCDIESMVPPSALTSDAQVLGPILWSPLVDRPEWWARLPQDRNLAYLNLGSTGSKSIVPKLVIWLLEEGLAVMVGCPADIPLPDSKNVFRAAYLPGEASAQRAQLTICNGGGPSAQQAILSGSPVLGICSNLDQILNMQLFETAGLGLGVRGDQLKKNQFKEMLLSSLGNQSIREKVASVGRDHHDWNLTRRFSYLIREVLESEEGRKGDQPAWPA